MVSLDHEVAYVLMGFPRLSESFISNEILLLERAGLALRLFVIKRGEDLAVHRSVGSIRAPQQILPPVSRLSSAPFLRWLRDNWPAYRAAHLRLLRSRPLSYARCLVRALVMCIRYRHSFWRPPRKVFIREFLQAGYIAAQLLEQPRVRLIHGHFCHGATTIAWHVSQLLGIPFSFTAHAKDIYQTEQNPGNLLERKLRAASFVTTCTATNCEHLRERCADRTLVSTVYHGLDTSFFQRTTLRPPSDTNRPPLLLAVGRFVEKKGLRYLVRACAVLRDEGVDFRCLLVGEHGDQFDSVVASIASLGLQDSIRIQGMVTHDQLRALYAQATIFVLPCVIAADGDRDGIPNVIAEAMAMSLPVVTTAVSGITELLTDGHDGVLVPERDSGALAQALTALLRDPARCAQLGSAARQTILRQFDSSITTHRLLALFRQAMTQPLAADLDDAAEARR